MTKAELQAELKKYREVETTVLAEGQAFTADGDTITRATLYRIQTKIEQLEQRLSWVSRRSNSVCVKFGGRS